MKVAKCAQKVIEHFNITTAPALYFDQIFSHYNIICREKVFSAPNYMGSLHRSEGLSAILVNTNSKNMGRINFTKAHELGHFCLNHRGGTFLCTRMDMSDFTKKQQEIEANHFAREFLLPEQMVKPISLSAPFDFETIKAISDQYLVSKLAASFRILDFHSDHYAFVSSKNGAIIHSGLSGSLIGKIKLRRSGSLIDSRSYANAVLNSDKQMNGYSVVDPSLWIVKNQTDFKISLKEYSKANKSIGTVMTLIKVDFL
jgi:Zn-dependent peptidase ImmA (M78 family)